MKKLILYLTLAATGLAAAPAPFEADAQERSIAWIARWALKEFYNDRAVAPPR